MGIRIIYSAVPTITPGLTISGPMTFTMTSDRLVGRDTAGSGASEELTVGGNLEFTGSGGIQRGALTGDVTAAAGGAATTIANDVVTFAKMQNISASRILGRTTGGAGDVEQLSAADPLLLTGGELTTTADQATVLGRPGGAGSGPVQQMTATAPLVVAAGGLTTTMATSRLIGRTTAGTGVMEELTATAPLSLSAGTLTTSMATARLLGRTTAGTGVVEELQISSPLAMAGGVLSITKAADVGALTDSTGGTANSTLEDVTTGGLADPAKCNNNFADLTAQINSLRTILRTAGFMA